MATINFDLEYSGQLTFTFNEVEFGVLRLDVSTKAFNFSFKPFQMKMAITARTDTLDQVFSFKSFDFELDRTLRILPGSLFLEPKGIEMEVV